MVALIVVTFSAALAHVFTPAVNRYNVMSECYLAAIVARIIVVGAILAYGVAVVVLVFVAAFNNTAAIVTSYFILIHDMSSLSPTVRPWAPCFWVS
jgi:hypothetical protein